jgi:hypothetical protein
MPLPDTLVLKGEVLGENFFPNKGGKIPNKVDFFGTKRLYRFFEEFPLGHRPVASTLNTL